MTGRDVRAERFDDGASNHEPFLAVVGAENAYLRSGPADDYYTTNALIAGQTLEVYYVTDDQWCAVRPPQGSFSWIDARNVKLGDNRIGEVLINGVNARVGSESGNECGAIQIVLDRGEKVFVLERVETPNDIDTPVWYKITPPAGEFRFIRMNELRFDAMDDADQNRFEMETEQPRALRELSPILLVSGVQPQHEQRNHRPSSHLSSNVVPPGSLPIPGASGNAGGHFDGNLDANDAEVRMANTKRPSTMPPTSQQTPPHTSGNSHDHGAGIDSNDFREVLDQLKLDLADTLIEQEVAGETMQSLSHQARMLYQAAPNQSDRAEVYRLIAGMERATRVRRYETGQDQGQPAADRYDGRTMSPTRVEPSRPRPEPLPPIREPNNETRPSDNLQRLALPRIDTISTTPTAPAMPGPHEAEPMARYSAQESFFDNHGRYDVGYHDVGYDMPYHGGQRDIEIYLDRNGRLVDASGQAFDERMLDSILHGADTVLMYDPNSGGYSEIPRQERRNQGGQFARSSQHAAPQKSWLQRLVSGEMFRGENKSPNARPNTAAPYPGHYGIDETAFYGQNQSFPTGSGYAPYTYQLAYDDGTYRQDAYPSRQDLRQYDTVAMATGRKSYFSTSQPSLISQSRNSGPAMREQRQNQTYANGRYGNNAAMTPGSFSPNSLPSEIVMPQGVEVQGEFVFYDESQGLNLLDGMQNMSQQDQLSLLIQGMASSNASGHVSTNHVSTNHVPAASPIDMTPQSHSPPRPNLPLTEAESKMMGRPHGGFNDHTTGGHTPPSRSVRLMSSQQDSAPRQAANHPVVNHHVTGHIENGVGRVSRDAFDAVGKLGRVRNAVDDMPKYVLVDENGRTIFLSPTNTTELGPYVGQTVGVTGIQGNYRREGETFKHISTKAVYPITR